MYLVVIAWMYVVVMMVAAEASSSSGTLLGAFVTFVFYGLLPLAIVMYLLGTPARRRARRALLASRAPAGLASDPDPADPSIRSSDPDHRRHSPGDTIATVRKEP